MVAITIAFQPSPVIDPASISEIKIFRKANTTTPSDSYLVTEWAEQTALVITANFTNPTFTDPNGDTKFWYRTQTCDSNRCAPLGPLIPGHGNSAFARLRAGYGYLSDFTPNSIDRVLLYDEEHKATEFVVEQFLRRKFDEADINSFYLNPLPSVRMLTEIIAARSIITQLKPSSEDSLRALKEQYADVAKEFAFKKSYRTNDITEKTASRDVPAEISVRWGR